jgi:hypothetical protein
MENRCLTITSKKWEFNQTYGGDLGLCSPLQLILMIFKLEKTQKKGKQMENQKAKLQN